jgi:multidrug resistance efflux pump
LRRAGQAKRGTLLFEIQRNTYEAQLEQAKASLASAQATALKDDINYRRFAASHEDCGPIAHHPL